MGEGVIKTLRPLSPHGIKEGWGKHLIDNFYRNQVMGHLISSCVDVTNQELICLDNKMSPKSFVRYGSKVMIRHHINQGNVISMLFYRDENCNSSIIGAMIAQQLVWYLCIINLIQTHQCIIDEYGYTYFNIMLGDNEYEIIDRKHKFMPGRSMNLWQVGLALPYYGEKQNKSFYCLVTEDGYSLDSNLQWKLFT